ncbi:MAG: pantetheine-phosphate adenylyltransferase [Saprospiraceae bacterium]|jgi:pantetheine-phosphate adenylyltransferase|nr:pantetheine-phosphate adenylyltransferase [Saprospiraceae bacterium]MBK6481308.1 pantetheine-phosphate adenylyltransferase [Saprospiraceae bacterium]MBK6818005.1 pantetheine-phosphate adenylyltransferase [Saprospiraceae bacterium]MBK7370754.1 pantetheine-phosphate adenylyltransferase [Saprospiraceae bacterium]MBK7436701.1 pantetheine-phosphate adenylyltransferase [Saprospiraceae bacterium]
MRIAVFPGSFDPITIGHVDIVYKALPLFDRFIIAIGTNTQKKSLYSLEDRMQWIRDVFEGEPKIVVDFFDGLTAEYAQKISADYLVRGLRNGSDFDYEKTISQVNQTLAKGLETIFFISSPEVAHISSTIVREIISGGGDASPFIPKEVHLKIR